MARSLPHYRDFRRIGAPAQVTQQIIPKTLPAPTRGLVLNENPAFMQPGGALLLDNWFVTENTLRIRGGSQTWSRLAETAPVDALFTYISGSNKKMFAANASKLYNVTSATATAVTGITITDGHFSTAQLDNAAGAWLLAVNDLGNYPLRFDGTNWVQLAPGFAGTPGLILGPGAVAMQGLTQVWKYRRRLFFIQGNTMSAWYLDIDAVAGQLLQIPLSGSFTLGGSLLFGCAWSVSAGDGIDDKCIFVTTEGEIAIFTGTDPSSIANWKQQGRYQISKPMGKNSWLRIGGDVLIATVDGIVPISQALVKDVTALEFAALTRPIHQMWKQEVLAKNNRPWSMCKWDEFAGLFVTWPGGLIGEWRCAVANTVTGAWCRFTGWDALNFCTLSGNMFFGTQDGRVVQADIGGKDYQSTRPSGTNPETTLRTYTCSYVGGWEVFGAPPYQFMMRQARCSFNTRAREPFIPQVTAAVNYVYTLPLAPLPGPDISAVGVWDEGLWGSAGTPPPDVPPLPPPEAGRAVWDDPAAPPPNTRTTYWVSIGETGYSHAMIVQVSIFQQVKPDVELLGVSVIAEQAGVAV
jgi:hypothetical protein